MHQTLRERRRVQEPDMRLLKLGRPGVIIYGDDAVLCMTGEMLKLGTELVWPL
jgi:hypothetical protein